MKDEVDGCSHMNGLNGDSDELILVYGTFELNTLLNDADGIESLDH